MFSSKAVKTVIKNHMDLDKSFQKNCETYTRYNSENVEIKVHFSYTTIEIYKGENAKPKWIYILGADSQKEFELSVKSCLKFIEDNTK
ncbi:hypothetical protein [Acinetobacter beijerinckii]|uniref:Uncharacterized protein n=1 Tax=Acinetobacter beijerinckii CIP 110307 TaxID=1217648 RepID=N9FDH4_9GAMM|nr:hypothetical protein [Acinetobacter beijerinckii]ENW02931.1 hypothetical protein F933_03337 [Acinetobacter beijerinckii CIP 110307]